MISKSNEEKIDKIVKHWFNSGKPLDECIRIVEPDIKIDVLERIFEKHNSKTGGGACELSK